jgi:hypothetical protein
MIPRKQIGWSQEENLLWEISKQLDKLLCINTACPTTSTSTSSTTTTTTTIPLVNAPELFQDCGQPCGTACPVGVPIYYDIWMTQECIDSFPTIGCEIWDDEERTKPFNNGTYNLGDGTCIVITGGVITDILL